ncbi:hypothetical protein L6452_18964 [Arctium lappa]|uniref:Uncharacterized protein n=1 Tax=Arctium lappa TaxID=4217 RepID=A0ACB9B6Q5_ARCLA|nr:hypothetical protein L6452_18964 [Arctium lappa]
MWEETWSGEGNDCLKYLLLSFLTIPLFGSGIRRRRWLCGGGGGWMKAEAFETLVNQVVVVDGVIRRRGGERGTAHFSEVIVFVRSSSLVSSLESSRSKTKKEKSLAQDVKKLSFVVSSTHLLRRSKAILKVDVRVAWSASFLGRFL